MAKRRPGMTTQSDTPETDAMLDEAPLMSETVDEYTRRQALRLLDFARSLERSRNAEREAKEAMERERLGWYTRANEEQQRAERAERIAGELSALLQDCNEELRL